MKPKAEVCPGVYEVGGGHWSDPDDCCVYLVDGGQEAALIDAGAGKSTARIIDNISRAGVNPQTIKYIIATHGHIDHIGGLKELQDRLQAQVVAHQMELPAIQDGLPHLTAASWYRVHYHKVVVDKVLTGAREKIDLLGGSGTDLPAYARPHYGRYLSLHRHRRPASAFWSGYSRPLQ